MWPEGKSCAAAFSFDFDAEEVWIGEDPANAGKPGVLSQGTYGAKIAVPLLLELLGRKELRATFFIPGRVAERHPDRVRAIVEAGHEIAHHGWTHRPPATLSREEEEAELVRGNEAIRRISGRYARGYRSPSWDFSASTKELLEAHGFRYSSNLMDDLRPYRHAGSRLVEIPIQWVLDDAAHFWFDASTWDKKIATADEVRAIWEGEFRGYHRLGGAWVLTMHPQIMGRPYRLELLDQMIGFVKGHDDVWIATCGEVADWTASLPLEPVVHEPPPVIRVP
jgi:peptidoglycan/xylan/chitin deacetylase (PgdA/CDA1 family)